MHHCTPPADVGARKETSNEASNAVLKKSVSVGLDTCGAGSESSDHWPEEEAGSLVLGEGKHLPPLDRHIKPHKTRGQSPQPASPLNYGGEEARVAEYVRSEAGGPRRLPIHSRAIQEGEAFC